MQDAQEQEASRSIIRGKSSQTGLRESARITFELEGASRADKVATLIAKIEQTRYLPC
jgi:hypothetical protein